MENEFHIIDHNSQEQLSKVVPTSLLQELSYTPFIQLSDDKLAFVDKALKSSQFTPQQFDLVSAPLKALFCILHNKAADTYLNQVNQNPKQKQTFLQLLSYCDSQQVITRSQLSRLFAQVKTSQSILDIPDPKKPGVMAKSENKKTYQAQQQLLSVIKQVAKLNQQQSITDVNQFDIQQHLALYPISDLDTKLQQACKGLDENGELYQCLTMLDIDKINLVSKVKQQDKSDDVFLQDMLFDYLKKYGLPESEIEQLKQLKTPLGNRLSLSVQDVINQHQRYCINTTAERLTHAWQWLCISNNTALIESARHAGIFNQQTKDEHAVTPVHLFALTGNHQALINLEVKSHQLADEDQFGSNAYHYAVLGAQKQLLRQLFTLAKYDAPSEKVQKELLELADYRFLVNKKLLERFSMFDPENKRSFRIEALKHNGLLQVTANLKDEKGRTDAMRCFQTINQNRENFHAQDPGLAYLNLRLNTLKNTAAETDNNNFSEISYALTNLSEQAKLRYIELLGETLNVTLANKNNITQAIEPMLILGPSQSSDTVRSAYMKQCEQGLRDTATITNAKQHNTAYYIFNYASSNVCSQYIDILGDQLTNVVKQSGWQNIFTQQHTAKLQLKFIESMGDSFNKIAFEADKHGNNLLMQAVLNRCQPAVIQAIMQQLKHDLPRHIEHSNRDGKNVLMLMCEHCDDQVVLDYISYCDNISDTIGASQDHSGKTLFQYALERETSSVVEKMIDLLQQGQAHSIPESGQMTPIMLLAKTKQTGVLKKYLSKIGKSVHLWSTHTDKSGQTELMYLIKNVNDQQLVQQYLQLRGKSLNASAQLSSQGNTEEMQVIAHGDLYTIMEYFSLRNFNLITSAFIKNNHQISTPLMVLRSTFESAKDPEMAELAKTVQNTYFNFAGSTLALNKYKYDESRNKLLQHIEDYATQQVLKNFVAENAVHIRSLNKLAKLPFKILKMSVAQIKFSNQVLSSIINSDIKQETEWGAILQMLKDDNHSIYDIISATQTATTTFLNSNNIDLLTDQEIQKLFETHFKNKDRNTIFKQITSTIARDKYDQLIQRQSPFMQVILNGNQQKIKAYLDKHRMLLKQEVNTRNIHGESAMMLMAKHCNNDNLIKQYIDMIGEGLSEVAKQPDADACSQLNYIINHCSEDVQLAYIKQVGKHLIESAKLYNEKFQQEPAFIFSQASDRVKAAYVEQCPQAIQNYLSSRLNKQQKLIDVIISMSNLALQKRCILAAGKKIFNSSSVEHGDISFVIKAIDLLQQQLTNSDLCHIISSKDFDSVKQINQRLEKHGRSFYSVIKGDFNAVFRLLNDDSAKLLSDDQLTQLFTDYRNQFFTKLNENRFHSPKLKNTFIQFNKAYELKKQSAKPQAKPKSDNQVEQIISLLKKKDFAHLTVQQKIILKKSAFQDAAVAIACLKYRSFEKFLSLEELVYLTAQHANSDVYKNALASLDICKNARPSVIQRRVNGKEFAYDKNIQKSCQERIADKNFTSLISYENQLMWANEEKALKQLEVIPALNAAEPKFLVLIAMYGCKAAIELLKQPEVVKKMSLAILAEITLEHCDKSDYRLAIEEDCLAEQAKLITIKNNLKSQSKNDKAILALADEFSQNKEIHALIRYLEHKPKPEQKTPETVSAWLGSRKLHDIFAVKKDQLLTNDTIKNHIETIDLFLSSLKQVKDDSVKDTFNHHREELSKISQEVTSFIKLIDRQFRVLSSKSHPDKVVRDETKQLNQLKINLKKFITDLNKQQQAEIKSIEQTSCGEESEEKIQLIEKKYNQLIENEQMRIDGLSKPLKNKIEAAEKQMHDLSAAKQHIYTLVEPLQDKIKELQDILSKKKEQQQQNHGNHSNF